MMSRIRTSQGSLFGSIDSDVLLVLLLLWGRAPILNLTESGSWEQR